jgi:hypothetical protein
VGQILNSAEDYAYIPVMATDKSDKINTLPTSISHLEFVTPQVKSVLFQGSFYMNRRWASEKNANETYIYIYVDTNIGEVLRIRPCTDSAVREMHKDIESPEKPQQETRHFGNFLKKSATNQIVSKAPAGPHPLGAREILPPRCAKKTRCVVLILVAKTYCLLIKSCPRERIIRQPASTHHSYKWQRHSKKRKGLEHDLLCNPP